MQRCTTDIFSSLFIVSSRGALLLRHSKMPALNVITFHTSRPYAVCWQMGEVLILICSKFPFSIFFSLALIHISSDSSFIPQINHLLLSLRRVTEVMVIKQIDLKINYEIKFRVSPTFNDKLGKYIWPFTNTLIISHLLVDIWVTNKY